MKGEKGGIHSLQYILGGFRTEETFPRLFATITHQVPSTAAIASMSMKAPTLPMSAKNKAGIAGVAGGAAIG